MNIKDHSAIVTGAASGLGLATAQKLIAQGAKVVLVDMNQELGQKVAAELGAHAAFVQADITSEAQFSTAIQKACEMGALRAVVHCAGIGGPLRILDKEGNPADLQKFEKIVQVNLVGSFNVLRLAAAAMAKNEVLDGERGVCVLTASIAAFEGQIGQIPYASSKAGVVGMTLVAARDLATKHIRVVTIAPGLFDTPILDKLPAEVKESLGKSVPHPSRLGKPAEFALTAAHIIENPIINGETIRLDGAMRMAAR